MTEEIIIDGIDVSKCEAFFKVNKTCYNCYACEGSDCYFKQRKRLEQERNELLEEVKQLHNGRSTEELYTLFGKPIKYWEELEQENKELKKFFDSAAKKNISLENKMKEYHEQYDELYWTTDKLVKDKTRLKQALEEISGLASPHCTQCSQIIKIVNEVLK